MYNIPKFIGRYSLTDKNTIYCHKTDSILKPYLQSKGYLKVSFGLLHRIIASVHLGLDLDSTSDHVDHIDGNKLNNDICNLRVTTNSGNRLAQYGHIEINLRDTITHKVCRKCKLSKLRSEFNRHKGCSDGLGSYCKSCMIKYRKSYNGG